MAQKFRDFGVRPATSAWLVERIARIAAELDRPVATPDEARAILFV